MKSWVNGFAFAIGVASIGCGGEDVKGYEGYGTGMPGSGLKEGGEVLLESYALSPMVTGGAAVVVNKFYAFQYGGSFTGASTAPMQGQCTPFEHPHAFPVHDLPVSSADYVDWGANVTLKGPGRETGLVVPKVVAAATPALTDNRPSPTRKHLEGTWIYGGPAWQDANFQDKPLQAGEYSITIGGAHPQDLTWNFPPAFNFPLNNGTEDHTFPVTAPTGGFEMTWEPILNPDTPHDRLHTYVFIAFAALPGATDLGPTPLYLCQPPDGDDGSFTVPKEVMDSIPATGIMQSGRLTHYMEKMTDNAGEARRLDLFSIYCSVSLYHKQ